MLPLVVSQAVTGVNLFLDRFLLAWYSADDFAAALQSGIAFWMAATLFLQTVMFATTFVAQYLGAGAERQIGRAVWTAVHLSLIAGVCMLAIAPLGYPVFRWIGHVEPLPELEGLYFFLLTSTGVTALVNGALSCFFSGLGRTGVVLVVSVCSCLLNACLNCWMIFSPIWIFPEGIAGAAWATIISQAFSAVFYALLMLARYREYEERYALFSSWRWSGSFTQRMLRFALPSGIHQTIDMVGFTTFLQIVGLFGFQAQHASNMAMNINLLLFIPAIGLHIALTILAGQFCGAKDYGAVQKLTASGALICLVYMSVVMVVYVVLPDPLLELFRGNMPEERWQELLVLARTLLLFVAFYSLFDALFLVYSAVLKGAGDTKFVMWLSMFFSTLVLTVPCIVLAMNRELVAPRTGLLLAWTFCANYIIALALMNMLRYRSGAWQRIQMVGDHHI
jgi:MATE family multidrug resistance protein